MVQCVRSWPYSLYKNRDNISIRLNDKNYVLYKGKHYQILEQTAWTAIDFNIAFISINTFLSISNKWTYEHAVASLLLDRMYWLFNDFIHYWCISFDNHFHRLGKKFYSSFFSSIEKNLNALDGVQSTAGAISLFIRVLKHLIQLNKSAASFAINFNQFINLVNLYLLFSLIYYIGAF